MSAEHATLYQYNLVNAQNHYIGFAQTETVGDHLAFLSSSNRFPPLALLSTFPCRPSSIQFLFYIP